MTFLYLLKNFCHSSFFLAAMLRLLILKGRNIEQFCLLERKNDNSVLVFVKLLRSIRRQGKLWAVGSSGFLFLSFLSFSIQRTRARERARALTRKKRMKNAGLERPLIEEPQSKHAYLLYFISLPLCFFLLNVFLSIWAMSISTSKVSQNSDTERSWRVHTILQKINILY